MPKWSDFGTIWTTLREMDIRAIRDEAERPFAIVCSGHSSTLDVIDQLLHSGAERYGASGINPLELIPMEQVASRTEAFTAAAIVILGVDARIALGEAEVQSFRQLERFAVPFLVVLLYGDPVQGGAAAFPGMPAAHTIRIADPTALNAPDQLATAVLEWLPGELHLSAAQRLPGLRAAYARDLIGSTAFTNATYALASGLPEQIPIVSVPFAAADILVLTKNQALLVYRLALAHGAPPDFQARIREVLPVIGGAFVWRQIARSLVGLIPVWGLVPKVAIAYAGTYTTGVAAWRWYASGELLSTDQLRRVSQEALALGRARAAELIARARRSRAATPAERNGAFGRVRRWLAVRRKPGETTPSQE